MDLLGVSHLRKKFSMLGPFARHQAFAFRGMSEVAASCRSDSAN
jgi:hypothetical protein